MKEKLKLQILKCLKLHNGTSYLMLSLNSMNIFGPMRFEKIEFDEVIEELLRDKEITRLEFSDPESPDKIASTYFLRGTTFRNFAIVAQETNASEKTFSSSQNKLDNTSDKNP